MPFLRALRPQLPRATGSLPSAQAPRARNVLRKNRSRRLQSTSNNLTPPPPPNATPPPPPTSPLSRLQRLLPRRFHAHLAHFRSAPVSHITSFLILHELTAVLPILGLTTTFYYLDVVPTDYVFGPWAGYASEAAGTWLKRARKRGWFGLGEEGSRAGEERLEREIGEDARRLREEEEDEGDKRENKGGVMSRLAFLKWGRRESGAEVAEERGDEKKKKGMARKAVAAVRERVTWDNTEKGYKIGVQLVAAYAITKMLLYPRLALSLWLTPSFARGMVWARKSVFGR